MKRAWFVPTRNRARRLAILAACAACVILEYSGSSAFAADPGLDGLFDEWAAISPLATDPAGDYGQVADSLKKAAQQLQKGQKPDAAENLAKQAGLVFVHIGDD